MMGERGRRGGEGIRSWDKGRKWRDRATDTIRQAGVVWEGGTAGGKREWRAGERRGDTGNLPATEQGMRDARCLEEGQSVNIAESEGMTNVEVGTAAAEAGVLRIHDERDPTA